MASEPPQKDNATTKYKFIKGWGRSPVPPLITAITIRLSYPSIPALSSLGFVSTMFGVASLMSLHGFKHDCAGVNSTFSAIYLIAERKGSKHKSNSTFGPSRLGYWTRKGLRPLCWMNVLGGGLVWVMDKRTVEESGIQIFWERLGMKYPEWLKEIKRNG